MHSFPVTEILKPIKSRKTSRKVSNTIFFMTLLQAQFPCGAFLSRETFVKADVGTLIAACLGEKTICLEENYNESLERWLEGGDKGRSGLFVLTSSGEIEKRKLKYVLL